MTWIVRRLSVLCEPFTDRAFGFPYILFFKFFTFNHICKVSRITGYMLFYLSCFAGVAKSVRSSCIVNVRASETSMSGFAAEGASCYLIFTSTLSSDHVLANHFFPRIFQTLI